MLEKFKCKLLLTNRRVGYCAQFGSCTTELLVSVMLVIKLSANSFLKLGSIGIKHLPTDSFIENLEKGLLILIRIWDGRLTIKN